LFQYILSANHYKTINFVVDFFLIGGVHENKDLRYGIFAGKTKIKKPHWFAKESILHYKEGLRNFSGVQG
jgi:hypothetical protein